MAKFKNTIQLHENDKTVPYLKNERLPTLGSEYAWTPERIQELDACKSNILHFAEEYFYIVTLDEGKQKIKLFKAQKRVLRSLEKNRMVITLASRQVGKTTLMTIFALWMTCFREDQRVIIVANKEATAKNILRRIKLAYEYLPNWLKPTVKQWDVTEVIFGNDSSIACSTTTSTAARGETASTIIIDEMAFIPHNFMEEFWKSTIPVVSSSKKSKIFAVSTSNGTSNKFYEVYTAAERGDGGWKSERIDWWEVPNRDEKWRRSAVAALGSEEAFAQEYGNEFLSTGESAISTEMIRKYRSESTQPKLTLMDNAYKLWESPRKGRLYVVGADVGEGVGSTASTVQVLDITDLTNIKQVATFRDQYVNPYNFARILYEISGQWGSPYISMERNNAGCGVLDTLYHKFKYEKIVSYAQNTKEFNYERLGVFSHTNTKWDAVTNMRYWINDLGALHINDIATVQEFETFVRYPNGSWKKKQGENVFDDLVCALMWALFTLKRDVAERYFEILKYDDNGNPLKLDRSTYDEESFFGSKALSKDFNDGDPMATLIGAADDDGGVNKYIGEGWTPANTFDLT